MQKLLNSDNKYLGYRWFFTSKGILVVGGKSDEQNEIILKTFLKPNYIVLHTSLPGSSFIIIQSDNPSKQDIEEAAVFCACFSKQWRYAPKTVDIDIFKGNQIYKNEKMKLGTFGVKYKKKTIKVKPELVLIIQKGKLRAVAFAGKEQVLAKIKPGILTKEQAADKIARIIKDKYHFPISRDEIMSAIPSSNIDVK
jgi:hypothetical protein